MSYFLLFFLLIALTNFVGSYYLQFFLPNIYNAINGNYFKKIAVSMTIGFIIIVSITAVYNTVFKTVFNWSFFFLSIPIMQKISVRNKVAIIKIETSSPKTRFYFVLTILLVFSYNFILYYRFDNFIFFDLVLYSKVASGIIEHGNESSLVTVGDFTKTSNLFLYHYGDLWLTGLLAKVFHLSSTFCLVYVVYPFLHLVLLLSTVSLFNKKNIWFLMLGIGLLYGSKLFLNIDYDNEALNQIERYRGFPSNVFFNKLFPIYGLFLLGVILYKEKFQAHAFVVFSFIPVFYATTTPALAGIAVGLICMTFINKKMKFEAWDIKYHNSFLILGSILFLIVFSSKLSDETPVSLPLQLYSFKTYVVLFVETMIKVFTEYFLIFFLLIYLTFKSKGKILFNPLIFIAIIGILSGFIFIYMHAPGISDIDQAINNISPVLLLIVGIEIVPLIKIKFQKIAAVFMMTCGLLNLSYFYLNPEDWAIRKTSVTLSPDFTKNVRGYASNFDGKIRSCSIKENGNYAAGSRWNFDAHNQFQDIFKYNIDFPLEIGFLFATKTNMEDVEDHPYFKMYKDKKVTSKRVLSFMKSKRINHLFISDFKSIDSEIKQHFTLLFLDKKTGGSFWKLKKY